MGLLSRVKTWVSGEILTASDLNAEFDNVLDNGLVNDKITGSSASVTAMRVTVDPGEVGTESLASSNDGEIKRIRNLLKEMTGKTQWYETPPISLSLSGLTVELTSSGTNPDISAANVLIVDTSGGDVTLQGLVGGILGQKLDIIKSDAANILTIKNNGSGTQKIKHSFAGDLIFPTSDLGGISLYFDGTEWRTLTEIGGIRQQLSSSSGSFTTTSATFVDVTNLSVSVIASGRPVMLKIIPDVSAAPSFVGALTGTGTSATGTFQFLRDAVSLGEMQLSYLVASSTSPNINVPPSVLSTVDVTSAGTFTYKLQAKNDGVNTTRVFASRLIAYEIR